MNFTYQEAVALARRIINTVDYDIYKEAVYASEEDEECTVIDEVADILFGEFGGE